MAIATHRVVRILFVLCLTPVLARWQLGSIGPPDAIHSKPVRQGAAAGRGTPDGPKRLPLSLGYQCACCRSEFGSRAGMDVHRRHSSSVGTPCADPRNSKSMSFTARGDHSFAGILRQHDTLGVLPIPAFLCLSVSVPCSLHAHFNY
jgi:hypothetical protein